MSCTYFLSRHPGAVEWASRQGLQVDHWLAHLDVAQVQAGDTVAGTLPIHLAAQVCERGGRYLHLSLDLPAELRGRELTADDLERVGARLEGYVVRAEEASPQRKSERLAQVRDAFLQRHPPEPGRSLADELIAERRAAAYESKGNP